MDTPGRVCPRENDTWRIDMALPSGLYIMAFPKDEDHEDGQYARYLGAVHVGEIPSQFRQSFLISLRKRFDKRYNVEQRPVGVDFYYKGIPDDSAPTDGELMIMMLDYDTMSADHQEVLNFATSVAKKIQEVLIESDKQNPDFTDTADYPHKMTQAATGVGIQKSAVEAYQDSIEWADAPPIIHINGINPAEREALGESIGRNTAKWLLKVDMSKTNKELQENVLSDMGFEPIEIAKKLYPNAQKKECRKISQRISKNKNKQK
jgi:hypothetical protein